MARSQSQALEAFSCSIEMSMAALSYKPLQALMGVSKASLGEPWKDWTAADKKLWTEKYGEMLSPVLSVSFRYMPSETCFFVRPEEGSPYLADLAHKGVVYSGSLLGRIDGKSADDPLNKRLDVRVYTRNLEGLGWCFTVALSSHNGKFGEDKKQDFKILCDFPIVATQDTGEKMQADMAQLGFEPETFEAGWDFTDEFGEDGYYPESLNYTKNGVVVRL